MLIAQGKLEEALASYQDSLAIRKRLAEADPSNAQLKSDMAYVVEVIGSLAYNLVLARDFARALEAADQAISVSPDRIFIYGNRAHALMFLDRTEEARAIYLQYRGKANVIGEKSWETTVLDDFAELHKAGLNHPLMDEIASLFGADATEPAAQTPEQAAR